jgi:hypothetical protein
LSERTDQPDVAVTGAAENASLDMSSEAGRDAARATQDDLTRNVGRRLTREDHDTQVPRWKLWRRKG